MSMIIVMVLRHVTANLQLVVMSLTIVSRVSSTNYGLTGDLGIVSNRKLRRLLEKGPKHREQSNIDWTLNKRILHD